MRALWLILPFTLGEAVASALDGRSRPVQLLVTVALWTLWLGVLFTMLAPRRWSLTPLRLGTTGAAAVGIVVSAIDELTAAALAGTALATLCAVIAATSLVGDRYIDGSSYGNERRLALRAPTLYTAVFVPVSCAALLAGIAIGPLLIASKQWIAGAIATAIGAGVALVAYRSLDALTRRWLVFVPAGIVVHDHLTLHEPVLIRRAIVRSIGPAPSDTTAVDLTAGAAGLALELSLDPPVAMSLRVPPGGIVEVNKALVVPNLASATIRTAEDRQFQTA